MSEFDPYQRLRELEKLYPPPPEDGEMFVFLPFSDIGYMNQSGWYLEERDKFYLDTWYAFDLHRLMYINQLSMLTFMGDDPHHQIIPHHTRDSHVLLVTKVNEKILDLSGFSDHDKKKGGLAALIHDRGTPAHGDATIKVDLTNLDEEVYWDQDLSSDAEQILLKTFATDNLNYAREEMSKIIQNQGLLGKTLDIADRISYVMTDLYWTIGDPANHLSLSVDQEVLLKGKLPEYYKIKDLLSEDREIGNIYKEVNINKEMGEIYFTNLHRLRRFLMLRALLHQYLYYAPISLGRDYLFKKLIEPIYATDGSSPLSPQILRRMTDEGLRHTLVKYHTDSAPDQPSFFITDYFLWYPKGIEKFETRKEAEARIEKLSQSAEKIVLGLVQCNGFKTGVDYQIETPTGGIVSYEEFDPLGATELEEINRATQGVYVFYTERAQEKPAMLKILERVRYQPSLSPSAEDSSHHQQTH